MNHKHDHSWAILADTRALEEPVYITSWQRWHCELWWDLKAEQQGQWWAALMRQALGVVLQTGCAPQDCQHPGLPALWFTTLPPFTCWWAPSRKRNDHDMYPSYIQVVCLSIAKLWRKGEGEGEMWLLDSRALSTLWRGEALTVELHGYLVVAIRKFLGWCIC